MTNPYHDRFKQRHTVFPVIHLSDPFQAAINVRTAQLAGADGVFIIGHGMKYKHVMAIHQELVEHFPGFFIGVNLLDLDPAEAQRVVPDGTPVWSDDYDTRVDRRGMFFGSVAFKYAEPMSDSEISEVLVTAGDTMDVVVTSGSATGVAPELDKIINMRRSLDRSIPLAIASGVTPDNVDQFLPHCQCLMVATGISSGFHNLDYYKTKELVDLVRLYGRPSAPGYTITIGDSMHLMRGFIRKFGETNDERFMDVRYCKRCASFNQEDDDPIGFLRDLLDMCVYTSGCSDSVVRMMQIVLEPFHESDADKQMRRSDLETRFV